MSITDTSSVVIESLPEGEKILSATFYRVAVAPIGGCLYTVSLWAVNGLKYETRVGAANPYQALEKAGWDRFSSAGQ